MFLLALSALLPARPAPAQEPISAPAAARPAKDPTTPESLPGAETFVYRDGVTEPLRIHVFKPQGWTADDRRPALMHFFGGGFLNGTPRQSAGWARTAARWGLVGLAPDYRTKERFGTDGTVCISDARAALRWVQEHAAELGLDPARVVVSGSSAGGHLALWTAIRHSPPGSSDELAPLQRPAALVLYSAASDTSAALGQRAERFNGHGDACSPVHQLDPQMPPVLMFHGDADPTVPYQYAVALDAALRSKETACEFITVPGGGHNILDAPGWREKVPPRVEAFLTRQGLLPVGSSAGVSPAHGDVHRVGDAAALKQVLPQLKPGDTVVLSDGTWRDADLVFRGEGTAGAPITLRAETPGKVVLTGASRLRLTGAHLVVDGLLFQDCMLQKGQAVVAFRDGDERVATHSRLTNSAIIDCNPPDFLTDYKWVSLYGADNRVDHCRFSGKNHQGTLLVVWLDGQPNRHRIDHNFFGPRPPHDRNGAEIIRVGTSEWSHTRSETVVEDNVFYRCDGEPEIISSKSWHNTYRGNTFIECQGALTLRHGHACVVENNVFLGRGREKTGGVRIIGEDHRVIGNHFEGLTGDRFYAALSMVLGIPDSPASGYHQVKRAEVARNMFIDCAHIFCLGIMEGRPEATLPPVDSVIADNDIVRPRADFFSATVPLAGFRIEGNRVAAAPEGLELPVGFIHASGPAASGAGADGSRVVASRGVGPSWLPAPEGVTSQKAREPLR